MGGYEIVRTGKPGARAGVQYPARVYQNAGCIDEEDDCDGTTKATVLLYAGTDDEETVEVECDQIVVQMGAISGGQIVAKPDAQPFIAKALFLKGTDDLCECEPWPEEGDPCRVEWIVDNAGDGAWYVVLPHYQVAEECL
jgi:hypothetical protein